MIHKLKRSRIFGFLRCLSLGTLLLFTWAIHVYHLGILQKPNVAPLAADKPSAGQWIGKEKFGVNQLILTGSPFARGVAAGQLTGHLLLRQETELTTQFHRFFPHPWLRRVFEVLATRWFWGIDKWLEPEMIEEMYGVSLSASHDFDYLSDPLTRQAIYHGLHEVGQMMVDQKTEDFGCTVAAVPSRHAWIIGRTFDFEGGRTFDSEKLMKWVFPDKGYAFVSVIWAGMVGAVTGVNEKGVYISLNAAGSRDFSRYGTPSTLVLMKALQSAATADEAVQIIRGAEMFITDIMVVSDRTTGKLYRIEKSPKRSEVIELHAPSMVANHLIGATWEGDSINQFRKYELTSSARTERGEKLLAALQAKGTTKPEELRPAILAILRDKGESNGHPLHLGNRRAIDALIATHAALYDETSNYLYVSTGPSLAGSFPGFDLTESFRKRTPVPVDTLPRDPLVTDEIYSAVHQASQDISLAEHQIHVKNCAGARQALEAAHNRFSESSDYYEAFGDYNEVCERDLNAAKTAWRKSLYLVPAYPKQVRELQARLKK